MNRLARLLLLAACAWGVVLVGAGCNQSAAPPPPPAAPAPGPPGSGAPSTPGVPGAAGPGGGASGSAVLSNAAPLEPPKTDDLELAEREKRRLKQREDAYKKEEDELRHTLYITENAYHDAKTGRYDPFAEINPFSDLNPVVGMAIKPDQYRVSGFGKQGDEVYGVIDMGFDEESGMSRTRVARQGDAFFEEYDVMGDKLVWRGMPVKDGDILPTGEIVDESKVYESLVLVAEVNIDKAFIVLKTIPKDRKTPPQRVTIALGSRLKPPHAKTEGEDTTVNLDLPPGALDNDEYIKYLYDKVNNAEGKKKKDFNDYLRDKQKEEQRRRSAKGEGG